MELGGREEREEEKEERRMKRIRKEDKERGRGESRRMRGQVW